jgi:hypothetical protein
MSDRLIQQALKLFEDQEKAGQPPSLAILGPPGSGKSLFLKQLFSSIRNDEACANKHTLMINLRDITVGSQADTYTYVNQALLQEAKTIGLPLDFDIRIQPSHLRFEEILRNLLSTVEGYLIIFIDHLESVPRVFASDLSHRFRNFLESTESDSAYHRLGLIIAGAVSLFDLKHGPNSAFQMLRVMSFPQLDADTRRELVEDSLINFMSTEMSPELIAWLADMTGGEPGFLEPLMMNLLKSNRQITLDEELLTSSIQEICTYSQVPALRNLALHLLGDKGLRTIVRELKESRPVMPRFVVPDIDRYQLSGAVVVGRGLLGQAREYQFRNKITATFLGQLYDLLESNNGEPQPATPLWTELQKIEAASSECLNARQIWTWMKMVQMAWKLTTGYEVPNLKLYLTRTGSDDGWWFDADVKGISGPETRQDDDTSTTKATYTALQNTSLASSPDAETFRAFVESDTDNISIAIPLYAREVRLIICATLSKTDAGRGITEFDVRHWIRFVQNVKQVAPTLVLAELGQKLLQEPRPFQQRSEPVKAVSEVSAKHIYLLPEGGAIIKEPSGVSLISGRFGTKDIENLNGRCLKLVNQWSDHPEFEGEIQAIANQLETAVTARFPALAQELVPAPNPGQMVITSDIEGLKLPFELFSHSGSHLALLSGLSRQIIGYPLRPEVSCSFDKLLKASVKEKQKLRILLVASFVDSQTEKSEEQKKVRSRIEEGCGRINLPTQVVEIEPKDATVSRVEKELIENGPYHLFHYTGHGHHYRDAPDLSGVVLRGEDDELEVVACKRLKAWFTAARSWLVYLSCCNSSATSGRQGLSEKYISMMDAIALAGVPNIVGFRCMVSDRGALHLADEFYRQVFEVQAEKNLCLAMLEARRAVERRTDFFDAWASSMLITQYS